MAALVPGQSGKPQKKKTLRRIALQILVAPLALLALALTVFEDWVWAWAREGMRKLTQWPLWARAEQGLCSAPLPLALLCFCAPGIVLLPAKLGALWLMAHGAKALGLSLFLLAKLLGAAIVGWVWRCTEPTLRRVSWLGRFIDRVVGWKDAARLWASQTLAGRLASSLRAAVRSHLSALNQGRKSLTSRVWVKLRRRAKPTASKLPP